MDRRLVSKDGGGPCTPEAGAAQSVAPGQKPHDGAKARAATRRYYGVMDDEGADDVFVPPPPPPPPPPPSSHIGLSLPAEGSTGVTRSTGATDATEAEANPRGLDGHRGDRRLMAAQTEADEVTARRTQMSEQSMDHGLSNIKVLTPPTDRTSTEDTGCLMGVCPDPPGGHHQDNARDAGDVVTWTEPEEDNYSLTETDSNPELTGLTGNQSEPTGPNPTAANQPPEAEESSSEEEHVDTRSLNYKLTKSDWVRRASGSGEVSQRDEEGTARKGEQGDGSTRVQIYTDIQQGEQLLQRLQLVQQRQDGHVTEAAPETRGDEQGEGETDGDETPTATDEGAKEEDESEESRTARASSSTMSDDDQTTSRTEADDEDDEDEDQRDRWIRPPREPPEVSARHRFSAAETSLEKQIQEENQAQQNLQRTGAVFNLADDPDVLEIPFKTNISLEPLPPQAERHGDRQFPEQETPEETSQETQRELVHQGTIPGGHSKGQVPKLEETKLLFEAFQQDNTGGPTRLRKHPPPPRGDVCPSVLERSCSLERFSLRSCSVTGAQSLQLRESETSEKREDTPEPLGSKSPTGGGSRDRARLSPYPKGQDKHPRLCRSMDSISSDASTPAAETRSKTREGAPGRESPLLQGNPFFKLRPALVLQPEVKKDIREAREREEELRRQRCTLYGEDRRSSRDEDQSGATETLVPDARKQSRGKLERVWPPPSAKSQQSQQEPKGHRAGGQKAPLWQRWESGQINGGQASRENT